jgi:trehalose/maltose hydrolase-like predicted phosphorylase
MDEWKLAFEEWDPTQERLREALCALGNGYFVTRGAAEESSAGGRHYPGTYFAGAYNRLKTEIAGRVIENEDLVNWPNWLCLTFRPAEGAWLDPDQVELLGYYQELDLRVGVLTRSVRFRDPEGRESELVSRRLVHMWDPHLAAIEWKLTPVNWSGQIHVRSGLDGNVANDGVARYRELNGNHLEVLGSGAVGDQGVDLLVQSSQSHIHVAQAARTRVFSEQSQVRPDRQLVTDAGFIGHDLSFECEQGQTIRVEKVAALYTSRDHAISEPRHEAGRAITRAAPFSDLLAVHTEAWEQLWNRCDIELADDAYGQLVLRLHIFHLLQTTCMNTIDRDVGVPSRGWHGEAYRGHVFWDELFVLPFLNLRIPEVTRELLMYRYRRLDEARRAAKQAGFHGAMYPWQSGSDGREESQVVHRNPRSGRWIPDNSRLQRHVNAAIAFNVWQYYQSTNDMEFLSFYGAEMILEIARFWASVATLNEELDRYEIRNVMGPDEYHDGYPDADQPGLNNNAYTNVMAAWTLRCALRILDLLASDRREELLHALRISRQELDRWQRIGGKMHVVFLENGIISQFEGYEDLKELDWEHYHAQHGEVMRLDRILEAEGDTPNRYKAAKQADVLMLFYLFTAEELQELFDWLGYDFEPEQIPKTIDYYMERTSHGSTLSFVVHSWVLARSQRHGSWHCFERALRSDIGDIQGGTTSEGIHLGAMAGTVDLVQRCFSGIEINEDVLSFNPALPDALKEIRFRMRYRGHWLAVRLSHDELTISFERGWSRPVRIGFGGRVYKIEHGETKSFDLQERAHAARRTGITADSRGIQ